MSADSQTRVGWGKVWTVSDAVAPAWHTVAVLLALLGLAALSVHVGRGSRGGAKADRMHAYLVMILAEWLLVAFIGAGKRWQGAPVRTLVGEDTAQWRAMVRDVGLAVAFLIVADTIVAILSYVLGRMTHPAVSEAMKALLPRSRPEVAAFLLLALTAGICEEIIFRGYLQRQFTVWTKSAAVGIAVQGIAFGLAHAYQGWSQVIVIAVFGCLFGLLARWRGSLRPGMVAHFLQDGVGGVVLARFLLR